MLGAHIRYVRESLGLSQSAVARQVQKDPSWLCLIEQDKRQPSLESLQDLCKVLPLDHAVLLQVSPCVPLVRPEAEGRAVVPRP